MLGRAVRNIRRYSPPAVVLFGAAVVLLVAYWPKPQPQVGESAVLPAAKEVAKVEKVRTEVKVVYVYPDKVKEKLDLPATVQEDTTKRVSATGKLDAEERPYTLTAVLDTDTGGSEVYARPDPLPWVTVSTKSNVGLAYGLKNGEPAIRLHGQQEILRLKAVRVGVTASADAVGGDVDTFIGVGAWASW